MALNLGSVGRTSGVAAIAAGLFLLSGCTVDLRDSDARGSRSREVLTDHQSIELDSADTIRVDVRMGAGELTVNGGSPKLVEADFRYPDSDSKPEVRYRSTAGRGDLTIEQKQSKWNNGDDHTRWDLRFNNEKATDFTARLGAGEVRMKLGEMNLRNVDIHMGVGELELDLRGKPKRSYDVEIHGGVGEARIHLPENVAIVAKARGGIGDIDIQGLKERNGRWIRPGHEDDAVEVRLDVAGGVGSIHID